MKNVTIYTDGACSGNPGPGGYGTILSYNGHRRELSGGYARTTNNRMELMAVIEGLKQLKETCSVKVVSDSRYVVDAVEKGWARSWRAKNWRKGKNGREQAKNPDLWGELLSLCDRHTVRFRWIRGHNEHPENERCDRMAVAASQRGDLPRDGGYERTTN